MLPGYRLKNLDISPGLVLAPMSGVTCMAFRRLIRELNPGCVGMVVTEFVSVEALTRKVPRSFDIIRFKDDEHPLAIQIFGFDINRMRDAAVMAQDAGADVLDVNCGCPAPKVVRKGGGCELMRQPDHLAKVLSAIRSAVSIPVTLKMRAGWDEGSKNCLEVAKICEDVGLDGIAVHGRTKSQMYRGNADWDLIWEVRSAVKIPVLGSGDVVDLATARARLIRTAETHPGVSSDKLGAMAGALIGRGALMNPFVFTEISRGQPVAPSLRQDPLRAVGILERYAELLSEEFHPKARIGKMKQLASQMLRGHEWRKSLLLANTFDQQLVLLREVREGLASRASSPKLNIEAPGLQA